MGGYAWVTLATNDAYSLGALVLAHSLRRVGTKHELACLVTPGVTATMREKLAAVFSLVQEVNVLDSKDEANLALLARPELGITFTKLHCWRLTQYEKCVFVDADALVVRNCDELFEREELSAAPDVGWPDCFNSGVFVFKPSQQTFASITAFAAAKGSFDGGDQGLLNMYFSDWASKDISKHLPFIYNMCSTATYSYLPAFKQFGDDVRIIHFIGITKPWLQYFDTLTSTVQPPSGATHLQPLLQLWWNIFCERVHPQLSPSMATSTLAPIWHAFTPRSYVPPFPKISDYSDTTNPSRMPDFSEFKDPWEEYSPRNDPFLTDNSALSNKGDSYCVVKYEEKADAVRQSDHSATQFAHNQQVHREQHFSYTPTQTYDQHREDATSHSRENRNQEHSVQHPEHYHWQQHSEQRHHVEQYQHNEQWTEQRHHHVQHQHHEQKHYEQQHYNDQRQYSEHHQQFHQHDHRNKTNDHHQHQLVQELQSAEVRHESHIQYYTGNNQASHQNADHLSHIVSHNESHTQRNNQGARDNFAFRCDEKTSEQALEAANKTDTRRIDFLPPSPAPCTDLHNVAMRSDPNVTEHLDNANTGIAGALAQLTLGEARSAEQVALEEHMRKQSWEQGHIDYLGRDSFDNIWKKICETLSVAPQRQPTPPKEDTTTLEITVKETATKETADALPEDVKVDKPAVKADKVPTQSLVCEVSKEETLSTAQIPEQKAPALSSEESITEAAATKVSSEPVQLEDACAKPTTELKDVKSYEISTEVLPSQPLAESLPARTIAEQCELASSQTTQKAVPQSESLLEVKEPPQVDSQTSLLVCKFPAQEAVTPVTQIDTIKSAPTEAKPEISASTAQGATQSAASISVDSPQDSTTSPVASEAPVEDIAKHVIEPVPDVTQPLTIDPSERHAEMLLAASEISTVSPVPIQVAESVLQAEPKESVLGAAVAVSDQAIATTVTAVHESTDIASAPTPMESVQLNGSACEVERRGDVTRDAVLISGLPEKADAPPEAKERASNLTKEVSPVIEENILTSSSVLSLATSSVKESAEQIARSKAAEPPEQIAKIETVETKPSEQISKTEAKEEKSAEQAAKIEATEAIVKPAETVAQAEITKAISTEQAEVAEAAAAKSSSEVLESSIAEHSPPTEEPVEVKLSNVPSTPTVTEATPPTSPSVESAQESEETTAKKSLKKSDSTDGVDGEGADKKATKKTVKKVAKKPKTKPEEAVPSAATEGPAADGSQSKAKKTVKTTKKIGTKTLETDTNVPETPPPSTPTGAVGFDAPVPPKRKTKSANAKGTTDKKSEAEE